MRRIEIRYVSDDQEGGIDLVYSQPKEIYSRQSLLKKLDEYEKEMLK